MLDAVEDRSKDSTGTFLDRACAIAEVHSGDERWCLMGRRDNGKIDSLLYRRKEHSSSYTYVD